MMPPARPAGGFTLLEVLVAVAIFALVGALAYGGLQTVLDARAGTDREAARLGELQFAVQRLQRDLEYSVDRPVRGNYGDSRPALAGADGRLVLTRSAWPNPAGLPRSSLQRVGYELAGTTLRRHAWAVLDRAQDSDAAPEDLLQDVDRFEFRFLAADRRWHDSWPPAPGPGEDPAGPPLAVEVRLELADWGRVRRLFRLPGARP